MAFSIDSTTINLAARRLEVIGNNVSNANTTGFKGSEFDQILASATASDGVNGNVGGRQSYSQGQITKTINPLDIAIDGEGFFRVLNPSGQLTYTRSGRFTLNIDGEVVNALGGQLTGYLADSASGKLQTMGGPVPLVIDRPIDPPKATQNLSLELTLDSRSTNLDKTKFDPTNTDTFSHFASTAIYDPQGNEMTLQTYYVKTSGTEWNVKAQINGQTQDLGSITFNQDGSLKTAALSDVALSYKDGSTGTLKVDLTGTVQYGTDFTSQSVQDGRALGTMDDYSVTSEGFIKARYTNGNSVVLAQVVLANFKNLNGLKGVGKNEWMETLDSGAPRLGNPGTGLMGSLQGSSIEEANIDLTGEMIKMIAAQRTFQVAAEMIKKQDQATQTVANIGN